jgi:hypothetical protein
MIPQTPTGCFTVIVVVFCIWEGMVSPYARVASSENHDTKLAAYSTSPSASANVFPFSRQSIFATALCQYKHTIVGDKNTLTVFFIYNNEIIPFPKEFPSLSSSGQFMIALLRSGSSFNSFDEILPINIGNRTDNGTRNWL